MYSSPIRKIKQQEDYAQDFFDIGSKDKRTKTGALATLIKKSAIKQEPQEMNLMKVLIHENMGDLSSITFN